MAARAIWGGEIRIAGFSVGVKLYPAVREERISFHLLHRKDLIPLKQQWLCAFEKAPVPTEEQVKGFELEKGRYLLVDPEELEAVDPEASRTIEVHEFVKAAGLDPRFRERVYTLQPEDGSAGGYRLLAAELAETETTAVCTWVMRRRAYLGALETRGRLLRLCVLRYVDEILPAVASEAPPLPLSEKELKLGAELVRQWTVPFDPGQFANEHEAKLRQLIEKKARGEKLTLRPPRQRKPTADGQLLQALEASLKKVA